MRGATHCQSASMCPRICSSMSECASATVDAYGRSGAGLAAFAPAAVAAGAVPALVAEPEAGSVLAVVAAGVGEAGAPPLAEDSVAVAPAVSVAGAGSLAWPVAPPQAAADTIRARSGRVRPAGVRMGVILRPYPARLHREHLVSRPPHERRRAARA